MLLFPSITRLLLAGALLGGAVFTATATEQTQSIQVQERTLGIDTLLLKHGSAAAEIVAPLDDPFLKAQAERIAAAAKARGVELPIVDDAAYRDLAALKRNLIVLGNRDSNQAIRKLYYLHYTLLDAKYPGVGGSELRSLHDPFGDGHNIVFVGGADETGVRRATDALIDAIKAAPKADGTLALGHLQEIHLGKGMNVPQNAKEGVLWERRRGYGDEGHFGWNLLSRNLALFYMTGEERFAQEFLRLAFPDEAAVKELLSIDKEGFDDPTQPLVKPYHYDAIMMILYWDLVEEHPFFTPEDRQRVTEAFAKQFDYHRGGDYRVTRFTEPAQILGNRHVLWEGLSLYALARYFDKYHPSAHTAEAKRLIANMYHPFNKQLAMNVGTFWWYNTFIEPAFVYAALSDPLAYEGNAVVDAYGQILVQLSDQTYGDWANRFSSVFMLNLMAAMTQDQAYVDMIATTEVDPKVFRPDAFRIGQSYWPAKPYARNSFVNDAGKVLTTQFDAETMRWQPDFAATQLADFLSYRQQPGAEGDFLQVDTKYESGRNPFHNFALISLRLDGVPLLRGYANQLNIYRDGLYASDVSHHAELLDHVKVGDTVVARGRIHNQNAHLWERTLLLRDNSYLVAFDTLEALGDSNFTQLYLDWGAAQGISARPLLNDEFQLTPEKTQSGKPRHYTLATSVPAQLASVPVTTSLGSAAAALRFEVGTRLPAGERLSFATVLRPGPGHASLPSAAQAAGGAIALQLPHPALLTQEEDGGLVLRESDHIFALNVTQVPNLLVADAPVTLDCNLNTGMLALYSTTDTAVRLTTGGEAVALVGGQVKEVVLPAAAVAAALADSTELEASVAQILGSKPPAAAASAPDSSALSPQWQLQADGFVQSLVTLEGQGLVAAAVGKQVLILQPESGAIVRTIEAPDTVGALYWWQKEQLLLIGCRDETLLAVDLTGKERWRHTAQMAQELIDSQKFYWFKSVIPGIVALHTFALEDGSEVLFVGGAGTVEILNADGTLQKRLWQTWGAVDGFVTVPAGKGQKAAVLCKRSMGGWPTLFEVTFGPGGWTQRERRITHSLDGLDMGSMGFSMVGRNFLFIDRLRPQDELQMLGDFNGALNRLMLWNLDGKPLQEADLGPGFIATSVNNSNYGRSVLRNLNVRGLAAVDFNGDASKEVVIALDRSSLVIVDADFKPVAFTALDSRPVVMCVVERSGDLAPLVVVGCRNGVLSVIDGQGQVVAQAAIEDVPTALLPFGNGFIAGSDKGQVAAFALNALP